MKSLLHRLKGSYLLITAGILVIANILVFSPAAFASNLSVPEVIETNMNAAAGSSLIVVFKTSASNTGTTLSVTMPAGYTVNATQTYNASYGGNNCTTIVGGTISDLPTSGTITAAGSGQVITFSGISAYTASTEYCGVLTSATAVTNPSAGTYAGSMTAGTDVAAQFGLDVITNDQVVVTATVPASFTLSLSSNTDPFTANLAVGTVGTTTGVTATMTTNGTGWGLYASDVGSELTSASTSHHILSTHIDANATITGAGGENYVTGVVSAGNSVTPAFAGGSLGKGGGLSNALYPLATGTGPTASATATVTEYAAISATTPAATDYTDTITLLGAGTF